MEQYIPKADVLAEIEREIEFGKLKVQQSQENNDQVSYIAWSEHIATCGKILSFINTLEVKEVDFKKEFVNYTKNILACDVLHEPFTHLYNCAKHFFALGMQQSKNYNNNEE